MTERMEPTMRLCLMCEGAGWHAEDCPVSVMMDAASDLMAGGQAGYRLFYADGKVRAERVEWRDVPAEEG